jgi:uncharacterized protein YerC
MVQLSKRPLEQAIQTTLYDSLYTSLALLTTAGEVREFLSDLLTPAEKIMLAKRLAIVILLEKGYNYRQISRILKVSTSTIRSQVSWLKVGGRGYRQVIPQIMQDEKWLKTFQHVEQFIEELQK